MELELKRISAFIFFMYQGQRLIHKSHLIFLKPNFLLSTHSILLIFNIIFLRLQVSKTALGEHSMCTTVYQAPV